MTLSKKITAVVMSLVMLLGCFAVVANAYVYTPTLTTGEIKLSVKADKTVVNKGDKVTFQVHADPGNVKDLSAFMHMFFYNKAQLSIPEGITTVSQFRTFKGSFAAIQSPSAGGNLNLPVQRLFANVFTQEELAYFDGGIQIAGQMTDAAQRWNPVKDEVYIEFSMVVSNTVQPGEEIWFGMLDKAFSAKRATLAVNGVVQAADKLNLSDSMVKLTVAGGEQPQASALKHEKRQVKMDWADQAAGTILPGSHQLRVISQIAEADLQKAVGATDDATIATKILKAGVVAFKGNKAAFNMETAKTLAQSEMLQQGDYSKSETTYIQHANGVYRFGARVEYKSALYDTAYVTYLAYVDETGKTQYLFLDAAEELLYATKQTDIENLWKGGQPKA